MAEDLLPELQERIAALEDPTRQGSDFDAVSWFWLILLGIVVPVALANQSRIIWVSKQHSPRSPPEA